jgi:hypothetical protein
LLKTVFENNYFVVWVTDLVIKEALASRTYQNAIKRCSNNPEFMQEVATAKQHFPLLCVQVRSHNRRWISQVEGTANIIKKLYQDFPNLGVVFDGWSRTDQENLVVESMIKIDKSIEEQIKELIPDTIPCYSTIGSTLYETIYFAHAIDLYTGSMGTGLTCLLWIANKTGVVHTSHIHWNDFNRDAFSSKIRENGVMPVWIPKDDIVENMNDPNPNRDYDCDWQVIYNELMQILQNLPKRI